MDPTQVLHSPALSSRVGAAVASAAPAWPSSRGQRWSSIRLLWNLLSRSKKHSSSEDGALGMPWVGRETSIQPSVPQLPRPSAGLPTLTTHISKTWGLRTLPGATIPNTMPPNLPHLLSPLLWLLPRSQTQLLPCLAAAILAWPTPSLPSFKPGLSVLQADPCQKPPSSGSLLYPIPEGPVSHAELSSVPSPDPATLQHSVSRPLQAWSWDGH